MDLTQLTNTEIWQINPYLIEKGKKLITGKINTFIIIMMELTLTETNNSSSFIKIGEALFYPKCLSWIDRQTTLLCIYNTTSL